jgi:hypothetical protein
MNTKARILAKDDVQRMASELKKGNKVFFIGTHRDLAVLLDEFGISHKKVPKSTKNTIISGTISLEKRQ